MIMPVDVEHKGIWFVYDGDCPICRMGASMFRVKEEFGSLHTVNAREEPDHWLMKKVEDARLDLDEGMVIHHAGQMFHGDQALIIMAALAEPEGWYNRLHIFLFRSPRIATIGYPLLRGIRNLLVKIRGSGLIKNLERL